MCMYPARRVLVVVVVLTMAGWGATEGQQAPESSTGWRGFSYDPFGGPVLYERNEAGDVVPTSESQGRYPVIVQVFPCGPADLIGLRAGDALIVVNGQDARDGPAMWSGSRPGAVHQLRVRRDDQVFDVALTEISYYQWDSECHLHPEPLRTVDTQDQTAARVATFKGFRAQFSPRGLVYPESGSDGATNALPASEDPYPEIVTVFPCSPADEVGLRPGDLIILVNGRDARGSPARIWRTPAPGVVQELRIRRGTETFDTRLTEIAYDDWNPECKKDPSRT